MEADRLGGNKVKLAFDTSFLILMAEKRLKRLEELVEVIGAYEPVVLTPIYEELKRLSSKGSRPARLACEVVKGWLVDYGKGMRGDEALLKYAKESGAIVATADYGLIGKLKGMGIRFVSVRKDEVYLG